LRVLMLKTTSFNGRKQQGEEHDVEGITAKRWIKNGIAEECVELQQVVIDEPIAEQIDVKDDVEESDDVNDESADVDVVQDIDYELISNKDLYKMCVERGLAVEQRQNKKYYIDALTAE